jgi:DNA-binding MarR family transcriptional regulator
VTPPPRPAAEGHPHAPIAEIEEVACLEILRAADRLTHLIADLVRKEGLSPTQYNALRILRDAGPAGLPSSAVGERMITREPDITRLLARLDEGWYITRARSEEDRRVVIARISDKGRGAIMRLDAAVESAIRAALGSLGAARIEALIASLEEIRRGPAS